MIPRVHAGARAELIAAGKWYEQQAGRGNAFLDAVAEAIVEVGNTPRRFARVPYRTKGEVRRYLIRRFPYAVIYEMRGDQAVVLAVAHTSRRPGYWRERLGSS